MVGARGFCGGASLISMKAHDILLMPMIILWVEKFELVDHWVY
jgi:hypothetical protein